MPLLIVDFSSRKLLRLRHAESKFESIYRRRKIKSKVSVPSKTQSRRVMLVVREHVPLTLRESDWCEC